MSGGFGCGINVVTEGVGFREEDLGEIVHLGSVSVLRFPIQKQNIDLGGRGKV